MLSSLVLLANKTTATTSQCNWYSYLLEKIGHALLYYPDVGVYLHWYS